MSVPQDFILAALFSEIGRVQKRAEKGVQGTVRELSLRWLEQKGLLGAANAFKTCGNLIIQASQLALGLMEPGETDQQRLTEDVGDVTVPLVSLFSKVPWQTIAGDEKKKEWPEKTHFMPLCSLSEGSVYPVYERQTSTTAYQTLWANVDTKLTPELTPDAALVLLENYTACVPCLLPLDNISQEDRFSDISLFDHLKMTTAIASCLYTLESEKGEWQEEPQFLLVGGDFSGVQDFIYRISSQGALKAVRGRSFFLELLTQHVVAELLEAAGCSRANVLYAGGAQFNVLLPCTAKVEKRIEEIRRDINTYLVQVHSAKLYLVLEHHQFGKEGFQGSEKGWTQVRQQLGQAISRRKAKKFAEFLEDNESQEGSDCRLCGAAAPIVKEEELRRWGLDPEDYAPLCRFCFLLVPKNVGEQYQKSSELIPFSQSLQKCQWCKATQTLVWSQIGEEIIVGCEHPLCLGTMETGECQVCRRHTLLSPLPTPEVQTAIEAKSSEKPELIWACPFCRNLYHLGEHLPELKCVRRSTKSPAVQPRMIFNVGPWFYDFPRKENFKANLEDDPTSYGWIVKDCWDVQPYLISRPVFPLSLGNYHPQEITKEEREWLGMRDEQKALGFSNLAKASIGSQLIGVLRMDVDNLGELFTRKIPAESLIPVRTSTLSRLLTHFFTDFINALCQDEGLPPDQKEPFWLFPEGRLDSSSKKRWVSVVYSGGDDLFIVGAWSEVIELAFDIHTAFRRYVCDHPEITLSGGMIVHHEDFPLYQLANLAKMAEEKAKENESPPKSLKDSQTRTKDSFSPFYLRGQGAFFWDEAEKMRTLAKEMVTYLKQEQSSAVGKELEPKRLALKVPHAFLTQLFEIVEIYKQEGKLYLPRLHYVLAHDDIDGKLKQKLLSLNTIRYLYPVLLWLDLLSRREESHA
jgi:hypothetical protein